MSSPSAPRPNPDDALLAGASGSTPTRSARTRPLGGLASGLALAMTMFVEAVGYGMVAPTLPFMARGAGASERGIGLLVGMYAAVGLVAVIPLAALANRYGRRSLILLGLGCLSLASLGFVIAPTYPWLVVARLTQGLAASAVWVGALTVAADLSPDHSMGRSLSWITGSWSLGFVLGPALGGIGSVRTPFIIYACLAAVALVAAMFGLKETGVIGTRTTFLGIFRVMRLPAVLASAAATFSLAFYYGVIEAFLPLMVSETGADRVAIAMFFVVAGLPSVVLPRFTGYLADRMGDIRLIVFGLLFASLFSAAFLYLFRTIPHWIVFVMIGLVEVFIYIPAVALLNRGMDQEGRIFANGSHNYAFSAGFFLGPVLAGLIVPVGGYPVMFAMLTAVMLGGVVVILATRRGIARQNA